MSTFLGSLSKEEFLRDYWNKKPLLIKNAIKNPEDFADFDDFFELACDADQESRMVFETGGEYPWQAMPGPFSEKTFKKKGLWTLIVHNLDVQSEELALIKKNVNFIPEWHFDDIMATISMEGASVGAHIDDYSVFIFQGKGQRKWLLEENPDSTYHPDFDIRLLKNFHPQIEWVLNPGDMIYIPPNVAHHGISLSQSISYSIGFKSIRYKDLLDQFVGRLIDKVENESYVDEKVPPLEDRFLVPSHVVDNIYSDFQKILSDKESFKRSLLNYLSRPKNEITPVEGLTEEEILLSLKSETTFLRDVWNKFVATKIGDGHYLISISNLECQVSSELYSKIRPLFEASPFELLKIPKKDLNDKKFLEIIKLLFVSGIFYFSEGDLS